LVNLAKKIRNETHIKSCPVSTLQFFEHLRWVVAEWKAYTIFSEIQGWIFILEIVTYGPKIFLFQKIQPCPFLDHVHALHIKQVPYHSGPSFDSDSPGKRSSGYVYKFARRGSSSTTPYCLENTELSDSLRAPTFMPSTFTDSQILVYEGMRTYSSIWPGPN
jgi:hypothetical protein